MKQYMIFALFAVAIPLALANYGPASGAAVSYLPSNTGLDELVQAAAGGSSHGSANPSATPNAEIQPTPEESARLGDIQAQLQALNNNPVYKNLQNSDSIADSLAESSLASNIRQGNVNIVPPNVVNQGEFRSLLVPSGRNNHQVIATQPLPPIIVNQPGSPPAHISSGPPAVVKAAPVIYKIKPSVIYQQEVINKVPTPLSLNPVYVKVYKPGKQVDAPTAPVVAPVYQPYGGGPVSYAQQASVVSQSQQSAHADNYGNSGYSASNAAPLYASPSPYSGGYGNPQAPSNY